MSRPRQATRHTTNRVFAAFPAWPRLIANLLLGLFLCSAYSCAFPPEDSLALVDEVYAALDPAGTAALARYAADVEILASAELSARLYAVLAETVPQRLYLSPLLVVEIPTILEQYPDITIATWGSATLESHERVYQAVFSEASALRKTAALLTETAQAQAWSEGSIALVQGPPLSDEGAALFRELSAAILRPDGTGEEGPALIDTRFGLDSQQVDFWRARDITAAVLFENPKEAVIRAGTLFDDTTFLVLVQPLESGRTKIFDRTLVWDVPAALERLSLAMTAGGDHLIEAEWIVHGGAHN